MTLQNITCLKCTCDVISSDISTNLLLCIYVCYFQYDEPQCRSSMCPILDCKSTPVIPEGQCCPICPSKYTYYTHSDIKQGWHDFRRFLRHYSEPISLKFCKGHFHGNLLRIDCEISEKRAILVDQFL